MEEINLDNYLTVDIDGIALDRNKLGSLVFEGSSKLLNSIQELFKEFNDLSYETLLTPSEIELVKANQTSFINFLNRLKIFDMNQATPKVAHDQFEVDIENFYNSVNQQLRPSLVYLRQEASLKSQDQKSLQAQAKQAAQASAEFEKLSKQLKAELETIASQKQDVEKNRGQLASKTLAKHFDTEASYFGTEATSWLKKRDLFFWILCGVVGFNLLMYFALSILIKNDWQFHNVTINGFFNRQYVVLKVAIVAILTYGIAFCSKNYRVNSNLAVINRHRRSVAQTIEDFLDTNPRQEIQDQIIKEGVIAMFQHIGTGYLSHKESSSDGNPATELITNIIKNVSSDK